MARLEMGTYIFVSLEVREQRMTIEYFINSVLFASKSVDGNFRFIFNMYSGLD